MGGQGSGDIDGAALIARAADIATRLTARGTDAESAGRLPQETIDEVVAAGIMRLSVPARYGGLDLPYPVVPQVSRMLGRGCLATSWVIGILVGHNFQMGFWPKEAQDDFWSTGPSKFAPGFIVPGGLARKVDGGWRLTGHWRMGSGYPHGDWILLGAFEELQGSKGPLRRFALPVADTTAENNWSVSGLAATGTWDCKLDGVFVPDHRQFPSADLIAGTAPGVAVNAGALWRIPLITYYYPNLCAMMLGAAEGVAALVTEKMKTRMLSYGGAKAADLGYAQSRIGAAHVKLNAAAALLEVESNRIWANALSGRPFTQQERAGVRANCTWIAKLSREVASELIEFSGTGSFMMDSPLQRFHREINVLASHAFYDVDRMNSVYGQILLGKEPPPGELV
jgi:3-hydroxy-9,10-secoandrosta-1,3,5(10)-triene-9,17-dione monooxygenase